MPERRRFATAVELAELLARREPGIDWPKALEALAAEGVVVDALVKVEVREEV